METINYLMDLETTNDDQESIFEWIFDEKRALLDTLRKEREGIIEE
jgi:hypothetical protein